MKAVCLVAHPDDCAIFGYQFIVDHADWDWSIWYLTYTLDSDRVQEMQQFWNRRHVKVAAGGFIDSWDHVSKGQLGFDAAHAGTLISGAVEGAGLILTHNHLGEYAHPHHLFIHAEAQRLSVPKVYFGRGIDDHNWSKQLSEPAFDSNELPLHKSVIDGFDLRDWRYLITPEAGDVLEYEHE